MGLHRQRRRAAQRWSHLRRSIMHVVAEQLVSCGDVREDAQKVRAVAREVYSDLVGLEDSSRSIHGERWQPRTPVKQRFPNGGSDLEPLVLEACRDAAPDVKPFGVLWARFA